MFKQNTLLRSQYLLVDKDSQGVLRRHVAQNVPFDQPRLSEWPVGYRRCFQLSLQRYRCEIITTADGSVFFSFYRDCFIGDFESQTARVVFVSRTHDRVEEIAVSGGERARQHRHRLARHRRQLRRDRRRVCDAHVAATNTKRDEIQRASCSERLRKQYIEEARHPFRRTLGNAAVADLALAVAFRTDADVDLHLVRRVDVDDGPIQANRQAGLQNTKLF